MVWRCVLTLFGAQRLEASTLGRTVQLTSSGAVGRFPDRECLADAYADCAAYLGRERGGPFGCSIVEHAPGETNVKWTRTLYFKIDGEG